MSPRRVRVARWRFVPRASARTALRCISSRPWTVRIEDRAVPPSDVPIVCYFATCTSPQRPAQRCKGLQPCGPPVPSLASPANLFVFVPHISGRKRSKKGATDRKGSRRTPRQPIDKPWVNVNLLSPPPEPLPSLYQALGRCGRCSLNRVPVGYKLCVTSTLVRHPPSRGWKSTRLCAGGQLHHLLP